MNDEEIVRALEAFTLKRGFITLELPPTIVLQPLGDRSYRLVRAGIPTEKQCRECKAVKTLTREHWRPKTGGRGWHQPCLDCQRCGGRAIMRRLERHLKAEGLI